MWYKRSQHLYEPFPSGSRGVFYYHTEPSLPPISGALRFRLCNTIREFEMGTDLQSGPGQPWQTLLCRIIRTQHYQALRHKLLEEGLVTDSLYTDIRLLDLPSRLHDRVLLFDIQQPLILDLGRRYFDVQLVTRNYCALSRFANVFRDTFNACEPYEGIPHPLCQFNSKC